MASVVETLVEEVGRRGCRNRRERDIPGGAGKHKELCRLIDTSRNDTRALEPALLDCLDWLVAQLKNRGICANLNPNADRTDKSGDGVRDYEFLGFAKALSDFGYQP